MKIKVLQRGVALEWLAHSKIKSSLHGDSPSALLNMNLFSETFADMVKISLFLK